MLISIKDKNFSGQLIKNSSEEILLQLKPYNKKVFIKIKDGSYEYLNELQLLALI